MIISHKIPKVVIGTTDTHSKVDGKGIQQLKESGCNVGVGVLEDECKAHHKRFLTFHNKRRPYIILKWAETLDGFIAPKSRDATQPVWITNELSKQLTHKWRSEEQSILVGTTTVLHDNPSLTVREWTGKNPIRIVIDKEKKLSQGLTVFDDNATTMVISEQNVDFNQPVAQQICDLLFFKKINSVIIEGGSKMLQTFIDENLWDEARIFTGNVQFGDGIKAPKFSVNPISEVKILDDILKFYVND